MPVKSAGGCNLFVPTLSQLETDNHASNLCLTLPLNSPKAPDGEALSFDTTLYHEMLSSQRALLCSRWECQEGPLDCGLLLLLATPKLSAAPPTSLYCPGEKADLPLE